MKCKNCQAELGEIVKALGALEFCPKCGEGIEKGVELPEELAAELEGITDPEQRSLVQKGLDWAISLVKGKKKDDDESDDNDEDDDDDDKCPDCKEPYGDCKCDDDEVKKAIEAEMQDILDAPGEAVDGNAIVKAMTDAVGKLESRVHALRKALTARTVELSKSAATVTEPAWATELKKSLTDQQARLNDVFGFVERIRQHPAAAQIGAVAAGDGIAGKELTTSLDSGSGEASVLPKNYDGLIKGLGAALEAGEITDRRVIDSTWLRRQDAAKVAQLEEVAAKHGYEKA